MPLKSNVEVRDRQSIYQLTDGVRCNNVSLGEFMPTHLVNLDALIPREDFEAGGNTGAQISNMPLFKVEELAKDRMYFNLLRKPDFQRTTNNWTPEMIVDLVESYLDGKLVPALILWHSKDSGKVFIIDGAHRLSALIAWVNDDYGDGKISQADGKEISTLQAKFHKKTKELMDSRIGSYATLYRAAMTPVATDSPETLRRGRAIATLQPDIQKVLGDAEIAESSFLKINANPATIDPTDFDVIKARKKPNAIATRALMRAGLNYWAKLAKAQEIEKLAKEVYTIIFGQIVDLDSQSPDVPRAGQPYSSEAFSMVLDIVNIFNDVTPAMWQQASEKKPKKNKPQVQKLADDLDGSETVKFLERIKNVGSLVSDSGKLNPGSLGLDQTVYSYGATGKFHSAAFLATLQFAQELKKTDKVYEFTKARKDFEEFLVRHNFFINQLGHSKGSRTRSLESILIMFRTVLAEIQSGTKEDAKIVAKLKSIKQLEGLNDVTNLPAATTQTKKPSKTVQQAITVRQIRDNRERCPLCGARLPPGSRSKDHIQAGADDGKGTIENLQFTHPYCNTGYKEKNKSLAKK
jgi:hypothetical protein